MLLGIGVWSGIENAARIGWDAILGFSNLVRGRPFRHGMEPFELGSIIDTVKLAVFFACIAGGTSSWSAEAHSAARGRWCTGSPDRDSGA